jgi:hypothetical protein
MGTGARNMSRRILILISLMILLPTLACNSNKDVGNPKLDWTLNQLIQAENRGEAEEFANQHDLTLKEGKVGVTVYFISGQGEAAAQAVTRMDGESTSSYKDGTFFEASVPINRLDTLAAEKSINRIGELSHGVTN